MKYLPPVAAAILLAYATSAIAQDASASVSASVSASAGVSDPSSVASSALSSASSDLSSALSSVSSEMSSASSGASSSLAGVSCDTLDTQTITTTAVDPSVLAAVTSVQVFALNDCAGLTDLATIDVGAAAAIGASPSVAAALQAAGETGPDIAGYTVEGTTLVVYVKHKA